LKTWATKSEHMIVAVLNKGILQVSWTDLGSQTIKIN